jgi:hypothetical protein
MYGLDRYRTAAPSARRGALFVVLWAFGFATTVLLISLWGRATSTDQGTLAESAREALTAEQVSDRIYSWMGDALATADGVDEEAIEAILAEIESHPEARLAMEALVAETVEALFVSPGEVTSVDIANALGPLVPPVLAELGSRGMDVSEAELRASLDEIEPVVFSAGAAGGAAAIAAEVHGFLTWAALAGLLAMVVSAALALALAGDRFGMARVLAIRLTLSALSFALLFQVGGWVLDPNGGRSAIGAGASTVVRSNGHVFLFVGGAAAAATALVTLVIRKRRGEMPPIDGESDDTRELVSV